MTESNDTNIDQDNTTPFDFKAPGRVSADVDRALRAWQGQTCTLLTEGWQGLLGDSISVELGPLTMSSGANTLKQTTDPGYAASLQIGPGRIPSLVTMSGQLVCTLVAGLLGSGGEDWTPYEPLTNVELSMLELLYGEIKRCVGIGWPELEPLPCELESCLFRPARSRIFAQDENIVRREILVNTAFGTESAWWLIPQSRLADLGISSDGGVPDADVKPDPRLSAIAAQLPVEIVVQLGTTKISLPEMNQLEIGDFLVLDQNVQQPVEAFLAGKLQWLGTPCRTGRHQGFEILASKR